MKDLVVYIQLIIGYHDPHFPSLMTAALPPCLRFKTLLECFG